MYEIMKYFYYKLSIIKCSDCRKETRNYIHITANLFNDSDLCFSCIVKWLNMSLNKGYLTYPYISKFSLYKSE